MAALIPIAAVGGVAGGILVADLAATAHGPVDRTALSALVAAAICAAAGLVRRRAGHRIGGGLLVAAALLAGTAMGAWRGGSTALETGPDSVPSLVDGVQHRLSGEALDDPRQRGTRQQLVLHEIEVIDAEGMTRPIAGRLLVWLPRGITVGAGDRLAIETLLDEPRDFDGFAYRDYLARKGVGAIARVFEADVIPGGGPRAALGTVRAVLQRGLNAVVPEPQAALGSGLLLGARSRIAPELHEDFATAGLSHLVAISGWHLAIVTALVASLTAPMARRPGGRRARVLVTVAGVGGYVLLTGAGPSVVRAALMAAAMLLARLGGSRAHAGCALMAACGAMLLAAPPVLWDVGFQLSLLATAGLIVFSTPIEGRLAALPAWIRQPVSLTLAAQLTTLPVLVANFERLSLVAPLANVIVVPLVPIAMMASALAAAAGTLDAALAELGVPLLGDATRWAAGGTAWLALGAMIAAVSWLAALPGAALDVGVPGGLAVAWYPLLFLAWWAAAAGRAPRAAGEGPVADSPGAVALADAREATAWVTGARQLGTGALRVARPRWMALGIGLVLAAVTLVGQPDGRLHLIVLDVGQGDAILVESPSGARLLVDGGPDPDVTLRRLGERMPFFARRIDVLLLSHPHQDHLAGLIDVLERFQVDFVLHAGIAHDNASYDRLLTDAAATPRTRLALARAGQTVELDATTTLEIVYPTDADAAAPLPDGDINNGSVVALLRHGRFTSLLTGDAEAPLEAMLVSRGLIPDVDVFKVGHHGSNSSTTSALLEAARPQLAVISAGVDNPYGHPHTETLAVLGARSGLQVLRTDLHGTIEIVSDGVGSVVRTASADPGSIGPWPSPISRPRDGCWPTSGSRRGSSRTPRACGAWRSRPPGWSSRPGSRSTGGWWRLRRCSTTSTRPASGAGAASMAPSARAC